MTESGFLVLVCGLLVLAVRAGGLRVGLGLVLWLAFLAALARLGFFADFDTLPPRLALAVVPALLAAGWFSGCAGNLPLGGLIGFQGFRLLMELVLWQLYREGHIPVQMTFEGRNFDILVGLSAPVLAWGVARRGWSRKTLALWNVLSLGLLLNIVLVALLSAPGPLRQFHNEPANTIIAYWPYVWLPGFVVPCALFGHLALLRRLHKSEGFPVFSAES